MREFKAASWPTSLKLVSCIVSLLMCAVSVGAFRAIPPYGFAHQFGSGVACLPPALLLGCLLFVVRSYSITAGHLSIRRLLWTTNIKLLGIHEARHDPEAIKGALRIFGNGGLFGITGLYWNKTLGKFRFFATDPAKSVVLRLHDRIVVISPQDPQAFLEELERFFPRLLNPSKLPERGPGLS
jgi:hypothetical protein